MYTNITSAVKNYFDKVTMTILHIKFKQMDLFSNRDMWQNLFKILLDEKDNSLLKKQITLLSSVGLKHIAQDSNSLSVDINSFTRDFNSTDFMITDEALELELNKNSLEMLNIFITNVDKKTRLTKNQAEKLLKNNKTSLETSIEKKIANCDITELLFTVYLIASKLSVLSNITYSKLKLKETIKISDNTDITIQTLNEMNDSDLLIVSSFIGEQKFQCDSLFNIVYKMYLSSSKSEENTESSNNMLDINHLFSKVSLLCKMNLLLESISLLYEKKYYIYLDKNILHESDEFQDYLLTFMNDTLQNDLPENMTTDIQSMYKKCEGFYAYNLMEYINYILNEEKQLEVNGLALESVPLEKLKYQIENHCDIRGESINRFIDSLLMQVVLKNNVEYKNKISVCPFVKLKDDRIIFTVPMLTQSYPLLIKRMSQQSFTNNSRMQKYFKKNYDELLLDKITTLFDEKKIRYWKNVHLDKITDDFIKKLFVKGITREFDLVFYLNDNLYIVEYKNWITTAFSVRNMLNEYKKSENFVNQHMKAINIIAENKISYQKLFGHEINQIEKIKLVMVFQNPNAFNYLNDNEEIMGCNLDHFLKLINDNVL